MTADKAFIEHLRRLCQMNIPEELEAFLLEEFGEEPFPYEYSEQDLHEQMRKLIMKYHNGQLDISLRGHENLLKQRHEELKDEYLDALSRIGSLENEIDRLKSLLTKHNVIFTDECAGDEGCDKCEVMF